MTKEEIEKDSKNARCSGLFKGYALTKCNNKKVFAQEVKKENGPFYCSVCLSDVIVRKCANKVDHFAHNARLSPTFTSKNQKLHNKCKNEICSYLRTIYPEGNWATERPIPINKTKGWDNEIIPDISGRIGNKNGIPIAIEVQRTAYTINKIFKKTIEYSKRGIYVLWIVPLEEELGTEPLRPRLFEKYLHSIYYGRTYYWTPKLSPQIIPIHYSPTTRYIEQSTWYDVDYGEERTVGGVYLTYKTIKNPNSGLECYIDKNFKALKRSVFNPKNKKLKVPECKIFIDTLEKWWESEEYRELSSQHILVNQNKFLKDYEYYDEYDDEMYYL